MDSNVFSIRDLSFAYGKRRSDSVSTEEKLVCTASKIEASEEALEVGGAHSQEIAVATAKCAVDLAGAAVARADMSTPSTTTADVVSTAPAPTVPSATTGDAFSAPDSNGATKTIATTTKVTPNKEKHAAKAVGDYKQIFNHLELNIREGTITTLIGANGSGKTTLFNLLTKNLSPQEGGIELRGENVTMLRLDEFARRVAIVHQHNRAPADLAVKKLVGYGRFPHRKRGRSSFSDEDERMIEWALETTELLDLAEHPISALSGGQMQRVWVAMALAQGTKVLLLDEPTTFLDIRYQIELLELLRELNRQTGMTIIMVLHDINQAIQFSDEVVALADGEVLAQGSPREIITSELLERIYGIELQVVDVHGQPYVLTAHSAASDTIAEAGDLEATNAADVVGETGVVGAAPENNASTENSTNTENSTSEGSTNEESAKAAVQFVQSTELHKADGWSTLVYQIEEQQAATPKPKSSKLTRKHKKAFRWLWGLAGLISFGLGLIGTVLPILPTTPFILLAAVCFARSSNKLNDWFRTTKLYKKVLEGFISKRTMTVKAKLTILVPVTVLLTIGFILMSAVPIGRIVVAIVWIAHVIYFGFIVKTDKAEKTATAPTSVSYASQESAEGD